MKRSTYQHPTLAILTLLAAGGCTGISIAPSCPNALQVGESAPLLANELNPGGMAKYLWEVIPPQLGKVSDPTKPSTMFEATGEGEAVIRLTASDGLYQVVSECPIRVAGRLPPPDDSDNDNADDNTNTGDHPTDNTNDNVDDGKGDGNGGRGGGVRKTGPPPSR